MVKAGWGVEGGGWRAAKTVGDACIAMLTEGRGRRGRGRAREKEGSACKHGLIPYGDK